MDKPKESAAKVFKTIKENLSDARKYNKEHNPSDRWSRKSQMVEISVWDNTEWSDGRKIVKSYYVKVEGKKVAEFLTHYDVGTFFSELQTLLNEQKKVRGWSGLNFAWDAVSLESGSWSGYRVNIIPKVCLADAPCKEYESLKNYINKYADFGWGGSKLGNFEFFSSAMGGKRGVLWDEYGERVFIDNKPRKCTRILSELRNARGTKDTLTIKRGTENYIDEEERRYSAYAEIECEGEKRAYVEVTIKTPSGKVKYTTKIY